MIYLLLTDGIKTNTHLKIALFAIDLRAKIEKQHFLFYDITSIYLLLYKNVKKVNNPFGS